MASRRRRVTDPSFRGKAHALPAEVVTERVALSASGAAGVHADQKTRKDAPAGQTNRVGSRSAKLKAVLRDQD